MKLEKYGLITFERIWEFSRALFAPPRLGMDDMDAAYSIRQRLHDDWWLYSDD
jgi:hypothetical protein